MSDHTGIEWTDATWNCIRGCRRVSSGCEHCYAEVIAARFSGPGQAYEGIARRRSNGDAQWTGETRFVESHLYDPIRWKEPRRIFVNSMSDLFYEGFSDDEVAQVFAVMALAPRHTFQVLTKRPERMRDLVNSMEFRELVDTYIDATAMELTDPNSRRTDDLRATAPEVQDDDAWPLKNVWLGVSTENQPTAEERIPLLLETSAAVRFLSCEPLLGRIDLRRICVADEQYLNALSGDRYWSLQHLAIAPTPGASRLDWVIAGGESGKNARPMHPEWARSLRNQCQAAGVAFFFKQWGEFVPVVTNPHRITSARVCLNVDGHQQWLPSIPGYAVLDRVGKKRAGRELDGREWNEYPLEVTRGR